MAVCKHGDSQVVPASDEMIGEMAGSILQNEVLLLILFATPQVEVGLNN